MLTQRLEAAGTPKDPNRLGFALNATMALKRTALSNRPVAINLIRYPLLTVKILSAIYFEALRLWLKKVPFYPHPENLSAPSRTTGADRSPGE